MSSEPNAASKSVHQTITAGQTVTARAGVDNVVYLSEAAGKVVVHTPEPYDGPDVLILCTMEGLENAAFVGMNAAALRATEASGPESETSVGDDFRSLPTPVMPEPPPDREGSIPLDLDDVDAGTVGTHVWLPPELDASQFDFFVGTYVNDDAHPFSEDHIEIPFAVEDNTGRLASEAATTAREQLEDKKFALLWVPSGRNEDWAVPLIANASFEEVFSVGETPHVMAHLVATQFHEASEVALPGETPPAYNPDDPFQTNVDEGPAADSEHGGTEPMTAPGPDMEVMGPFAEPVAASTRLVKSGSFEPYDPAGDSENGDGDSENEDAEEAPSPQSEGSASTYTWPGGPRWIHLFRKDEREELFIGSNVGHLGAYEVTESGTYRLCRYSESGQIQASGPEQSRVLLPIGREALDQEWSVLARLTMMPVSAQWIAEQVNRLRIHGLTGATDGFVPYVETASDTGFDGSPFHRAASSHPTNVWFGANTRWPFHPTHTLRGRPELGGDLYPKGYGGPMACTFVLPNPLAIAERRLGVARHALQRYDDWMQNMAGADTLSRIVSMTARDATRDYLAESLRTKPHVIKYEKPKYPNRVRSQYPNVEMESTTATVGDLDPDFDMQAAWTSEDTAYNGSEARTPGGPDLLAQFIYGAERQSAYLQKRAMAARAAVDRLIGSDLYLRSACADYHFVPDENAESDVVLEIAQACNGVLLRAQRLGAGRRLAGRIAESGRLDDVLGTEAPGNAEGGPGVLDQPAFKIAFKAAQRSASLAHMIAAIESPVLLAADTHHASQWHERFEQAVVPAPIMNRLEHLAVVSGPGPVRHAKEIVSWESLGEDDVSVSANPEESGSRRVVNGHRVTAGDAQIEILQIETTIEVDRTTEFSIHPPENRVYGKRYIEFRASANVRADFTAAARHLGFTEKRAYTARGLLDFLDILMASHDIYKNASEDKLSPKDAIDSVKVLGDISGLVAGLVEDGSPNNFFRRTAAGVKKATRTSAAGRKAVSIASRTGLRLASFGPYIDGAMSLHGVVQSLVDTDDRGLAEVYDPDGFGVAGHLLGGVGAVVMSGIVVGAGAGVFALGFALATVGAGLTWYQSYLDKKEAEANDALTDWLPGSAWGNESNVDLTGAFGLVRPGMDRTAAPLAEVSGGTPAPVDAGQGGAQDDVTGAAASWTGGAPEGSLPWRLGQEAVTFAENAFLFPVGVDVRYGSGPSTADTGVVGLNLGITLGYLPAAGTLMVNAQVNTESMLPVPVRCIVHFVSDGNQIRYRVLPEGEPLDVSALGGSGDTDLTDLAERQHWAYAAPVEWNTPTGETADARQLILPIGGDGSEVHVPPPGLMEREAERILDNTGDLAERYPRYRPGVDAFRRIEQQEETERTETERQRAILPAPDGLGAVLDSGAFTVTGTVAFSPVRPFDPSPSIPELGSDGSLVFASGATRRLLSESEIDFEYPSDVR